MLKDITLTSALVCLLVGMAVAHALGQSPASSAEPAVPEKSGKELHAFRIQGAPPRIDGRLDDEVWNNAQAIEDLVQEDPDNMMPPTERTVVQIRVRRSVSVHRSALLCE